jgi:hypothetical protein
MAQDITMYSNHLHQLIISPSAHFALLRNGELKYLKRKTLISVPKLLCEKIKRPVYFIMRDDFSGLIYAEIRITSDLSEIIEFLFNAWKQKDIKTTPLYGKPKYLMVQQTIAAVFPKFKNGLDKLGIIIVSPPDGFSSGVRAIHTLEAYLRGIFYKESAPLSSISQAIETCIWGDNGIPISRCKPSRFNIWLSNLDCLAYFRYDRSEFMKLFFK